MLEVNVNGVITSALRSYLRSLIVRRAQDGVDAGVRAPGAGQMGLDPLNEFGERKGHNARWDVVRQGLSVIENI